MERQNDAHGLPADGNMVVIPKEKLDRFNQIQREIARLIREQNAILSGKDTTRRAPQKRLTDTDIGVAFAGLMRGENSHERFAS